MTEVKKKILTVSVAAYNVEDYLEQCLESLAIPEIIDDIEVLVVNDGSSDRTPIIANEYVEKYPNSFILLNKENGGYGSTVNMSIERASGKYYKLLDGDDWVEGKGFIRLIHDLKSAEEDMIINRYFRVIEGENEYKTVRPLWEAYEGKSCALREIECDFLVGIWQLCIRTDLFKKTGYALPEKRLFTDQLFVVNSIACCNSVLIMEYPVYCYRIGRDGQSVSKESRIRNHRMICDNLLDMLSIYHNQMDNRNERQLCSRISRYYVLAIKGFLLMPRTKENYKRLKELIRYVKTSESNIYNYSIKRSRIARALYLTHNYAYYVLGGRISNW